MAKRLIDTNSDDKFLLEHEGAYKLVNLDGYSPVVKNFTINSIYPLTSTKITITIPEAPEDRLARDFILCIDCSYYTPQIALASGTEGVDYVSTDDDWNVLYPGLNILSFTELKRGTSSTNTKFLVGRKLI